MIIMSILSSKWTIGLSILVASYLILWLAGKKSVEAEVTIEASADEVWEALTDLEKVRQWNKVLIPVEGQMSVNNKIRYEFYQEEDGKAAVMDAKIEEVVKSSLINQKGGIPTVITFDHHYVLSDNENKTTVKIFEEYQGVMVPFWNPEPVEKAYERLLAQLKTFVENG